MSSSQRDPQDLAAENALLHNQVRELTRAVERIEAERIQYLQNVSHQLVSPLNAIKWNIENLTSARVNVPRAKQILRSVYSQATVIVHLAKNFALMSNLEAGHEIGDMRRDPERIDAKGMLANLADDFGPQGWDKDISIQVGDETFDGIPRILCVRPLLQQAFSNILENALKYSEPETEIVIFAKRPDEAHVALYISNIGIGVDAQNLEKVFERGFRSEHAKRKYPPGNGFGLYIAKRIVEVHRGNISVYMTEVGRTVFMVTLPYEG